MKEKPKFAIALAIIAGIVVLSGLILLGIYIFSPRSNAKYVAHMGYSELHVGNTADAFRAAAESTFFGIETDIRETSDGVLVCHHDAEAILADGSKKKIATSTYAELTSGKLKNKNTGESFDLCSFEEYLGICKEGGKIAVIELKEQCDDAKLSRILSAIDLHYDRKKASFISFEYANLIALSKIDATLNLQYLSETKNDPHFTSCLEKKISIDVKQNILTKKLVKEFHAAGLTVNAWTINKKYDLSIARIKGVDYVTTDCFHEKDGKIHA